MQRFLIFIVVCILSLSAACASTKVEQGYEGGNRDRYPLGGDYSSPRMTFDQFCKAVLEADVGTLKSITYSVEREMIDWDTFGKWLGDNRAKVKILIDDAEWQTAQTFKNRGIAMVRWGNGSAEKLDFVFEDGRWKIGGAKKMPLRNPSKNNPYVPQGSDD